MPVSHQTLDSFLLGLNLEFAETSDRYDIVVTALLVPKNNPRAVPFAAEFRWDIDRRDGFRESRRELIGEAGHRIVFYTLPHPAGQYEVAGWVARRHPSFEDIVSRCELPSAEHYIAIYLCPQTYTVHSASGRTAADAQILLEDALRRKKHRIEISRIHVNRITQAKGKPAPTCGSDGAITHHGWCERIS